MSQSTPLPSKTIRFAGEMPNGGATAETSKNGKIQALLAKFYKGNLTLSSALDQMPLGLSPTLNASILGELTEFVVKGMRDKPSMELLCDFFALTCKCEGLNNEKLLQTKTEGWKLLHQGIIDNQGPLAAEHWHGLAMNRLRYAIPAADADQVGLIRDVVFSLAKNSPKDMSEPIIPASWHQDAYRLSNIDYLIGNYFDLAWEHAGKKTTSELATDIEHGINIAPRTVLWLRLNPEKGPQMNRANSDQTLAALSNDSARMVHLNSIPMDWMSKEDALQQLKTRPLNLRFLADYTAAEVEHTRVVMDRLLAGDSHRHRDIGIDLLPQLPKIKELADGTDWVHGVAGDGAADWYVFRHLAALQSDSDTSHQLLVTYAKSQIKQAFQAMPECETDAPLRAWRAVQFCQRFMGANPERPNIYIPLPKPLTVEDLSDLARDIGFHYGPQHERYRHHDERSIVQSMVNDLGLSKAERDGLLSLYVEVGNIKISELPKIDQRKEVVGAALRNNPELLSEVTDLAIFKRLARQLNIPVELPDEAVDAAQRRDQALAAISDGEKPAKKRRGLAA